MDHMETSNISGSNLYSTLIIQNYSNTEFNSEPKNSWDKVLINSFDNFIQNCNQ